MQAQVSGFPGGPLPLMPGCTCRHALTGPLPPQIGLGMSKGGNEHRLAETICLNSGNFSPTVSALPLSSSLPLRLLSCVFEMSEGKKQDGWT